MTFEGTDRFQLKRVLGSGGMGVVYEAYDREREITVALKTLRDFNPSAVMRFKQEFRALANVSHPNLVSLYELFAQQDRLFFTMELIQGEDFLSYVWEGSRQPAASAEANTGLATVAITSSTPTGDITAPPLPEGTRPAGAPASHRCLEPQLSSQDNMVSRAPRGQMDRLGSGPAPNFIRLERGLLQLVSGVRALHERGYLHRDIKPSNVLVTAQGRVVLLDFGVINELGQRSGTSSPRDLAGTPRYMAPELLDPERPISEAADWYSVGMILFEALTGLRPFRGSSEAVFRAKQALDLARPGHYCEGIPAYLDELCASLLRRQPERRPGGEALLAGLMARNRETSAPASDSQVLYSLAEAETRLVGRSSELASLHAALEEVRAGRTLTVRIHGSSGIGKSALLRQFLDEILQRKTALVLASRCYEQESIAYKAVDGCIDGISRHLAALPTDQLASLLPEQLRELALLFPVLRGLPGAGGAGPSDEVADPRRARSRAFDGLRLLLWRLSRCRPVVLCVDDLQWGDLDSASLLLHLVAPPDPPPLLLLLAYRREEAERSPPLRLLLGDRSPLIAPASSRELALEPLPTEQARELALALLERSELQRGEADSIARESGGNPFFIQALARFLSSPPDRRTADACSLDSLIAVHVAALSGPLRQVLELVCVAGKPLPQGVVQLAAEVAGEQWQAVTRLRAARLVRTAGLDRNDTIEPYHDRIRETVCESLEAPRRQAHHRRLAEALVKWGSTDLEARMAHLIGAGDHQAAGELAARAGDLASQALAFERAAALYQRAIALLPTVAHERPSLLVRLGEALANAGRGKESAEAYLEAAAHCPADAALEMRRRATEQLLVTGHVDQGLELARQVLAELGMRGVARTPLSAVVSILLRRAQLRLRGLGYVERPADQVETRSLQRIDACWAVVTGLARGQQAWQVVSETWKALRRSGLFRLKHLRALGCVVRARAALAAAEQAEGAARRALLREALRACSALRRVRFDWASEMALLLEGCAAAASGQPRRAVPLLAAVEEPFEALGMRLFAAVSRRRRGELIGGDEGRQLVDGADRWMREQGIIDPRRFSSIFAPGSPEGATRQPQ